MDVIGFMCAFHFLVDLLLSICFSLKAADTTSNIPPPFLNEKVTFALFTIQMM